MLESMNQAREKQASANGETQDLWEFLYLSTPDLEQLLNQMLQLSLAESLQLCIVGPRGAGKSSLRRRYLRQANPEWHICDIRARRGQTPGELLKALAVNADLPTDCGEVALLHLLAEYTTDLSRAGRVPILVIDDAHLLPASTLQLILQLSTETDNNPAPWKLLIFSETPLNERLAKASGDHPELMQGLLTMNMPELSRDQAMQLFERLQQASGGSFDLDHKAVETLLHSPRYPGQIIGVITEHAGLETTPTAQTAGQRRAWRISGKWLAGAALAALLVLVLVFQQQINALFMAPPSHPDYIPPEPAAARPQSSAPAPKAGPARPVARSADHTGQPASTETRTIAVSASRHHATANTTRTSPAKVQGKPAQADQADKKNRPATTSKPASIRPTRTAKLGSAATGKPARIPAAITKKTNAGKHPATVTTVARGQPSPPPANRDHAWILSRPSHAYTLQLMASSHPQTVTRLRRRLGLPALRIYRWRRQGKTLYLLIHGQYPNLAAARAAARKLHAALRRNKPWPVRFGVIQQRLKKDSEKLPDKRKK